MDGVQVREIKSPALWKILVLCAVSALANTLTAYFIGDIAKIPLYLDTVFTVAMCFAAGLFPGLFTGVILSPLFILFALRRLLGFPYYLIMPRLIFTICVIVEVLLVCFFLTRIKAQEAEFFKKPSLQSFMGFAPLLLTLAALACLAASITGGIIGFTLNILQAPRPYFTEDTLKLGLLQNNVPVLAAAVLSRIPINIADRFIVIFGGFGISLLYRKLLYRKNCA
jgi:hypothetical protein